MHLTKPTNNIIWKNITCVNELIKLKEQWQKLSENSEDGLFTSPAWILPWLEVYWQKSWKLKIITGFDNGKLTIFIPLYSQPECQNFIHILYPLGQGEPEAEEISSEYQDILIYPKSCCSFVDIADQIMKIKYTAINWRALSSKSNWIKLNEYLPSFNQNQIGCRYLINTNKEYCLSKNTKVKWNRLNKKLTNHNANFFWVNSDSINSYWNELSKLHTSRWKQLDKSGAFSNQRFSIFHQKYLQKNDIKVSVLKIDDQIAAINYYLVNGHTMYFYQSGWEVTYKQYSPGFCLHQWSIENTQALFYDFMMGDIINSYKKIYGCNELDKMYVTVQIKHPFLYYLLRLVKKLFSTFVLNLKRD